MFFQKEKKNILFIFEMEVIQKTKGWQRGIACLSSGLR